MSNNTNQETAVKEKIHVTTEQEIKMLKDIKTAFDKYLYAYAEFVKKDITDRKSWPRGIFESFIEVLNKYGKTDGKLVNALFEDMTVPVHGMWHHYDKKDVHDGAVSDVKKLFKESIDALSREKETVQEIVTQTKEITKAAKETQNNFRDAVAKVLDNYDKEKKVEKKQKEEQLLEQIFGKTNQ